MIRGLKKPVAAVFAFVLFFMLTIQAHALCVNIYHGISYNDSRESVEEYEQILKDHGYLCVTDGCTENKEWTDAMLNSPEAKSSGGVYLIGDGSDYKLYVDEFDYEQWREEKISTSQFMSVCYGVDYYVFNHEEEINNSGLIGDAAEEAGYTCGWLTIHLNVDDALLSKPNMVYSIMLKGLDTGHIYDLSSSAFSSNGYTMRYKIPTETYKVYSIVSDMDHEADLSANKKEQFTIQKDTNYDFYISFKPIQYDPEIASGKMTQYDPNNVNEGKTLMRDGMTIDLIDSPVAEEDNKKPKIIAAAIMCSITLLIVIAGMVVAKRVKSRNSEIE